MHHYKKVTTRAASQITRCVVTPGIYQQHVSHDRILYLVSPLSPSPLSSQPLYSDGQFQLLLSSREWVMGCFSWACCMTRVILAGARPDWGIQQQDVKLTSKDVFSPLPGFFPELLPTLYIWKLEKKDYVHYTGLCYVTGSDVIHNNCMVDVLLR